MNKKLKLTKYYWVLLATDDPDYIMGGIEVVGVYKHKNCAEKVAKSLPFTDLRRVPVIVD